MNEVGIETIPTAGIPSRDSIATATNEDATNGAPSLNKDLQMLVMSLVIIAAIVMHYI